MSDDYMFELNSQFYDLTSSVLAGRRNLVPPGVGAQSWRKFLLKHGALVGGGPYEQRLPHRWVDSLVAAITNEDERATASERCKLSEFRELVRKTIIAAGRDPQFSRSLATVLEMRGQVGLVHYIQTYEW